MARDTTPTDRRDYDRPDIGDDWAQAWDGLVEDLDKDVPQSDTIANRPASGTYDDELFYATDQEILYRWDADASDWIPAGTGTSENPVPGTSHFESVNTKEAGYAASDGTVAGTWKVFDLPYDGGALVPTWTVGPNNDGVAPLAISNAAGGIKLYDESVGDHREMLKLFPQDDGVDNIILEAEQTNSEVALESQNGGRAGLKYGRAGNKKWAFFVAHGENNDPDTIENDDLAVLQNVDRLDINDSAKLRWQDSNSDNQARIIPSEAAQRIIHQVQNGYLHEFRDGTTTLLELNETNGINHTQTQSQGVVWFSTTSDNRPSSPVEGQRHFDSTLGQPIWYDGSNWVDAQGNTV